MAKREPTNPAMGISEGKIRTLLKSDLRVLWRRTARRIFVNSVRVKRVSQRTGRECYQLQCVDCGLWMPISEKAKRVKADGTLEKKAKSLHEIDHVYGITPLKCIRQDLGEHYHSMMFGKQEVVCVQCHKTRTAKQATERNAKKQGAVNDQ